VSLPSRSATGRPSGAAVGAAPTEVVVAKLLTRGGAARDGEAAAVAAAVVAEVEAADVVARAALVRGFVRGATEARVAVAAGAIEDGEAELAIVRESGAAVSAAPTVAEIAELLTGGGVARDGRATATAAAAEDAEAQEALELGVTEAAAGAAAGAGPAAAAGAAAEGMSRGG